MTGGIASLLQTKKSKHWVARTLDAYDKRQQVDSWIEPSIAIHPSGLRSKCLLAFQFDFLGHRGPIPMANRRRMRNGTSAHRRWKREFEEAGLLEHDEVALSNLDPDIVGHLDFILRDPLIGTRALTELKTTNDRYFSSLAVTGNPHVNMRMIYNWNPGYVYQLEIYAEYCGEPWDELLFVVENTNDQRYKIIPVASIPEYREEALKIALPAQVSLKEGVLVPRPFERESPACRYCSHVDICNRYEDGDEETLDTLTQRLEMLNGVER